jgi:putative ABC transport system ATP-binding protein
MSLVHLQNVEFRYQSAKEKTLDIPSMQIEKGERVFLFGPSGSGKSTFLEILAGVLVPQKGRVEILGQNMAVMKSHERDLFRAGHLGYVFQNFNLIPYLSVEENIKLPLSLSAIRRDRVKNVAAEISHLCSALGISAFLERQVTELSVGQQQRVAVARALLGSPELILADEPTSSLDHDHREKFIQLLFQVCAEKETTVLFVSHDRSLEKLFSRAISFHDINRAATVASAGGIV